MKKKYLTLTIAVLVVGSVFLVGKEFITDIKNKSEKSEQIEESINENANSDNEDVYDLDKELDKVDEENKLNKEGIELVIVSNNKEKRKGIYCTLLGVKGIFSCRKPFKKRISLFIKKLNYRKEEVILVGDQLLTDVQCGKNAKIKVILTEPIVKKDQWTTKFNRLIDKPIRKHLKNKGYLERVRITNGQE